MRHYQNDLFDKLESETLRDRGVELAMNADRIQIWKAKAEAWLEYHNPGYRFTADELTAVISLPDEGLNRNNVVGAMISSWSKRKLIIPTGSFRQSSRTARHAGVLRVWEKL